MPGGVTPNAELAIRRKIRRIRRVVIGALVIDDRGFNCDRRASICRRGIRPLLEAIPLLGRHTWDGLAARLNDDKG